MKCLELSVLFLQSLDLVLLYPGLSFIFSRYWNLMINLMTLIGSSHLSLFIFTIACFIGFIVGIGMTLYAAKETVRLVREVIQEKEK